MRQIRLTLRCSQRAPNGSFPVALYSFFLSFFTFFLILHFERALKTDNFNYISADLLELLPGLFEVFTRPKVDPLPAIDMY